MKRELGYIVIDIGTKLRARLAPERKRRMADAGFKEITGVKFTNAKTDDIHEVMKSMGVRLANNGYGMHKGEVGLWLSTISALRAAVDSGYDFVMVLEDDAVVYPDFARVLPVVFDEIPDDIDFFAWAIPENQRQDYYYDRWFDEHGQWTLNNNRPLAYEDSPHFIPGGNYVVEAYQGYRGVAIMYSRKGAQRVLDIIGREGIDGPTDLLLFTKHHMGELRGYTLRPTCRDIISHIETGTTVRSTGMYND